MTYSIKDVAEIFNLSIYTIRFYDKEGLLPFVSRNKAGRRVFTESDLYLIRTICCLKDTGMEIKAIRNYVDFVMQGADTIDPRKSLLLEHRAKILRDIENLTQNLNQVDSKLEIYASPKAADIVKEQIRFVEEEKRANGLPSPYAAQK
ncbi:MerR family transcriptional regulator [Paenibacillus camerounensis]|uniref:MerR family transcriptional regulator n=1 Tax=Paenibacillus camerounensis TaxID=1243663 RepID=UPI0005A79D66|nr:MerR family transcriptional regulator [Paenibacillus camerounensis]